MLALTRIQKRSKRKRQDEPTNPNARRKLLSKTLVNDRKTATAVNDSCQRRYAMLCHAMPCYAMLSYAMLSYAMLCYAMPCYAVLCYAALCYAMRHDRTGPHVTRHHTTRLDLITHDMTRHDTTTRQQTGHALHTSQRAAPPTPSETRRKPIRRATPKRTRRERSRTGHRNRGKHGPARTPPLKTKNPSLRIRGKESEACHSSQGPLRSSTPKERLSSLSTSPTAASSAT